MEPPSQRPVACPPRCWSSRARGRARRSAPTRDWSPGSGSGSTWATRSPSMAGRTAGSRGTRWRRAVNVVVARGCRRVRRASTAPRRRGGWLGTRGLRDLGVRPGRVHAAGLARVVGDGGGAPADLGYRYTTSHTKVTDLVPPGRRHPRDGLLAPPRRRVGAPRRGGAHRRARHGSAGPSPALRLALHPADLSSPALVRATLGAIDHALAP